MEFQAAYRYIVDFSHITHYSGFYDAIIKGLDLPDYAGRNLDALWDCLTGFIDWPCEITIKGCSVLSQKQLDEVQDILAVFKQAEKTYPEGIRILLEEESLFKRTYEYTIDLCAANDNVWKIMKTDNHLHQAVAYGLKMSWHENSTQTITDAVWHYLTDHPDGRLMVITVKNKAMMSEHYRNEWDGIDKCLQKAAGQFPERIKIIRED